MVSTKTYYPIMKYFNTFFFIILFASSCDKKDNTFQLYELSEGILINNEGNFQWGNASVSFFDALTNEMQNNVFQNANNRPLGDVLQSISIYEDKAFLVLNNSGKVEVVDVNSFQLIETITGLMSPRYIHFISSEKAYVSDLYSNKIAILDLGSLEITSFINLPGWSEEMVQIGDIVYIANRETDNLVLINSNSDEILSTYHCGFTITSLKKDNQDRIWLCGTKDGKGIIRAINSSFEQLFSHEFSNQNPSDLCVSPTGENIYFLSDGVWQINEYDDHIDTMPIIPSEGRLFYGLTYNDEKLYVADAKDYVQNGAVYVYDTSLILIDEWELGIIPSEFDFIY